MAVRTFNLLPIGSPGAPLDLAGAPLTKYLVLTGGGANDQFDVQVSLDGTTFTYLDTMSSAKTTMKVVGPYAKIRTNNSSASGALNCNWVQQNLDSSSSDVEAAVNLPAASGSGTSFDTAGVTGGLASTIAVMVAAALPGDQYNVQVSNDGGSFVTVGAISIPSAGPGSAALQIDMVARYLRINAVYASGLITSQTAAVFSVENNSVTSGVARQVRLAETSALPAYTNSNGTLTANANGALPNIDGVAPNVGDSILYANATSADNAIYVVVSLGSAGTPWVLQRRADWRTGNVVAGMLVLVSEGTANANTQFTLQTAGSIVVGTTTLTFGASGSAVSRVNYIASETGANNAIVGSLPGVTLQPGLQVTVQLAHSLQAGANTFNLNGGGALGIKSHFNTANNIATAYAATGVITLLYNGTLWLDMSQ